ncbi:hypothetical protein [Haloferax sp. DFSO52]|uniref:hypothetical protein n=1 Tax=Haloferax sp. DFSO52 TaxID=3388505 RepID=UPI003A872DAB
MVSGMKLMSGSQRDDYSRLSLSRYATQRVHERIIKEAEMINNDFEDIEPGQWMDCVEVATFHIYRSNGDFKTRCENDWRIEPSGEKGRRRARIAALKEAENGN